MRAVPVLTVRPPRCWRCGSGSLLAEEEDTPPAGLPRTARGYTLTCLCCARQTYVLLALPPARRRRRGGPPAPRALAALF